jgi:hypothetical protein
VPWQEIRVTRESILFWATATLQFGTPSVGTLRIPARVANALARAALGRWPEPGPFKVETRGETFRRVFANRALMTSIAVAFFVLVPRVISPNAALPPVAAAILLPAIAFGVAAVVIFACDRVSESR